MWSYAARPRRTIAEVLFDFKPFNIPFDYMLDLFPQLQPRSFSIASSLKLHPSKMELCVAIVKYKTKMRKIRRGIMTKWLSTLVPGDVISRVRIAKGTMNLPPSTDIPLIAIGPGKWMDLQLLCTRVDD
jgi:sulfite reductase alpha subunit-like flavoprotein